MNLNVKLNLLIIGQRWRSTPEEMSNTWWCSSRFCTGSSTISYLHLCEKTNKPFWNSADEQNLKLLTFKQSHVYNTSAFCNPTKFSQVWCCVFRNNFSEKKMCFNYFWFFTILLVKYHLNLLCDLDNVCLSFMILNVKWNLLIIGQRWRSTTGEMSNTWWCSSRFCTGTSTISYLHLCEKNKHTILEFSGWTKLEDTHI